jgi:hypothetical protein
MKRSLIPFTLAWALTLTIAAIAEQPSDGAAVAAHPDLPSAFLPQAGRTVRYQFSDTLTTPKESKSQAGTLTLTAVAGNEIKAAITIDGKATRNLDFHVDETGVLRPASRPDPDESSSAKLRNSGGSEPSAAEQALMLRLSIAARIGANPGEETSFPVVLNVPWANSPVNPILYVKSTAPDVFVADAEDMTSTNPPQKGQTHILRMVAISTGAGILAGEIGGTAGRIVRPIVTVGSVAIASRTRSGPQPTNVTLHITGQLADGRLRTISGDQEYTVAAKKQSRTFSDRWSLVAQ